MDWNSLVEDLRDAELEWLACTPAETLPIPFHPGKLAPAYQFTRRLLRHNHVPYMLGSTYIEKAMFDAEGRERFAPPRPFRVLEEHAAKSGRRLGRAVQTIVIGAADMETAALLGIPLNSPMMVVMRSVFDQDDVLIFMSKGSFRGDFARVEIALKPNG
jgi:GntR family transcriptional regulator